MSETNVMWTLGDVMEYTGLTRRKAARLLDMDSCPTLPRIKGHAYLVPSKAFISWYESAEW